jgi:hypothetical protein
VKRSSSVNPSLRPRTILRGSPQGESNCVAEHVTSGENSLGQLELR